MMIGTSSRGGAGGRRRARRRRAAQGRAGRRRARAREAARSPRSPVRATVGAKPARCSARANGSAIECSSSTRRTSGPSVVGSGGRAARPFAVAVVATAPVCDVQVRGRFTRVQNPHTGPTPNATHRRVCAPGHARPSPRSSIGACRCRQGRASPWITAPAKWPFSPFKEPTTLKTSTGECHLPVT